MVVETLSRRNSVQETLSKYAAHHGITEETARIAVAYRSAFRQEFSGALKSAQTSTHMEVKGSDTVRNVGIFTRIFSGLIPFFSGVVDAATEVAEDVDKSFKSKKLAGLLPLTAAIHGCSSTSPKFSEELAEKMVEASLEKLKSLSREDAAKLAREDASQLIKAVINGKFGKDLENADTASISSVVDDDFTALERETLNILSESMVQHHANENKIDLDAVREAKAARIEAKKEAATQTQDARKPENHYLESHPVCGDFTRAVVQNHENPNQHQSGTNIINH
jgi:hypothetical protein